MKVVLSGSESQNFVNSNGEPMSAGEATRRGIQNALSIIGLFLWVLASPDYASAVEPGRCIDLLDEDSLKLNNYAPFPAINGDEIMPRAEESVDFSYFVNKSCEMGGCYIKSRFGQIRISSPRVFEVQNYADPKLGVDALYGAFYVAADGDFVGSWQRVYFYSAYFVDHTQSRRLAYKIIEIEVDGIPGAAQKCLGKIN